MGISDASAAGLIIFLPGCSFFGSLLGGVVGDWAEARDPDRGRVRVALVSVSASILIVVIMFYIIPPHSSSYGLYAICLGLLGTLGTWCSPAVNQPMLASVVPPHMRATVMAAEYGIEASFASVLGGPVVGLVAEFGFGYTSSKVAVSLMPESDRAVNVHALRCTLGLLMIVPWCGCLAFYSLISFTYAKDRDRAVQQALVAVADIGDSKR